MPNCAVSNCKNTSRKGNLVHRTISFHCFPQDSNLKGIWIEATGNKDWFPTKHSTICSIHFTDDSFIEGKRRQLMKTAVPTIDILKTVTNKENLDRNSTPRKRKLEENNIETSTSSENTSKKKPLLIRLHQAQEIIKQKNKVIKKLREQNRRKARKIVSIIAILDCLKKKEKCPLPINLKT